MKISYLISKIMKKIYLPAIKNSNIHKKSWIGSGSHVVDSSVEKYSYISNYCTVINVEIGRFCSIADNCIIGGASHPIDWISSSPVFHEGKNVLNKNFSTHKFKVTKKTIIGNDVWIGNNSLIKSGVKIGNGVIIGMGAVVTKDVPPYEIWGGNPAKFIKKRFTSEIIKKIDESNWWNWDEKKIEEKSKYFDDSSSF